MTINKNLYSDIQDAVTKGGAAAALINENKRAVNEVIDVLNGNLPEFPQQAGDLDISTRGGQLILSRKAPNGTVVELNGGDIEGLRNWNPKTLAEWLNTKYDLGLVSDPSDQPLKLRRGTTAAHNAFTGANGEVTVDTEKKTLVVHDGVTPGGNPMMTRKDVIVQAATIADLRLLEPAFDGQQAELLGHSVAGFGGGTFYADFSSSAADDDGVVIVTAGGKRWIRKASTGEEWSVHWFGTLGNSGGQNALPRLRAALASIPVGKTLFFPKGNYFLQSASDEVLLEITKNINIRGEGARGTNIQATSSLATASIVGLNVTNNNGFLDVRNMSISGITITAGTAKHALSYVGGFSILSSSITNCWLFGNAPNGGYGLNFPGYGFAHSTISGCQISAIYAAFGDNNIIRDNLFLGTQTAITLDLEVGVKCTSISDNTIVNRDGALHLINGDGVRFINNQCEQAVDYGANQGTPSATVYIQGADTSCKNLVIRDNNFGGGTNVKWNIYIDNANKVSIKNNYIVAAGADSDPNSGDIYCTANSRFVTYGFDNYIQSQTSAVRNGKLWKAKIVNLSSYNINMPIDLSGSGRNTWVFKEATDHYAWKDESGMVLLPSLRFGTVTSPGTLIAVLPAGLGAIETLRTDYKQISETTGVNSAITGDSIVSIAFVNGQWEVALRGYVSNADIRIPKYQSFVY